MGKLSQLIDIQATGLNNPDLLMISQENPHTPRNNSSTIFTQSDSETSDNDEYLQVNPQIILTISSQSTGAFIEYRMARVIDTGSYGQVLEYRQKETKRMPPSLCIKVGLRVGDLDDDLKILESLPSDFQFTGLIDSVAVPIEIDEERTEPILIMPKMKGTVMSLFHKLQFPNLIEKMLMVNNVLYAISKTLLQLLKVRIYYTDLKLNNCLYRMNDDEELQVYLCDLGSAFLPNQSQAMATYPHIYRETCHHFIPELFDLQYGLLIIYFQMMLENSDSEFSIPAKNFVQLFHKQIVNLTLDQKKSIIRELFGEVIDLILPTQKILVTYVEQLENYLTTRWPTHVNEIEKLSEINTFLKKQSVILQKLSHS